MIREEGKLVERISLRSDRDVARARRVVTQAMDKLGARALGRTRFVTAVSEIARNAVVHGQGGDISVFSHDRSKQVSVICEDGGPGIEDIDTALQDGFTTGRGLGRGLGGAQRLCDVFEIESTPDTGVTIRMAVNI
ncbi:ATP-binding protein [Actibacterium sp. 188UL27-1]|uniref:ATP-binding protein n=1 Tax=Actibacterium sp. 188UL27-1 TaxID=2786961 RepID=UPI0019570B44|nr:ATP-binding protein [Actibacterium sp. 188UL27-1]MBM7069743.1 ATP-binding protein [Actibacterium sp. 188UL27-1]